MQPETPPENTQKDKSVGSSQINRQLYEVLWQFYDRGYQLVSLSPLMATIKSNIEGRRRNDMQLNRSNQINIYICSSPKLNHRQQSYRTHKNQNSIRAINHS